MCIEGIKIGRAMLKNIKSNSSGIGCFFYYLFSSYCFPLFSYYFFFMDIMSECQPHIIGTVHAYILPHRESLIRHGRSTYVVHTLEIRICLKCNTQYTMGAVKMEEIEWGMGEKNDKYKVCWC